MAQETLKHSFNTDCVKQVIVLLFYEELGLGERKGIIQKLATALLS